MNPADVPRVMKTKYPETVMVFGVISGEGDVMPPHIFQKGLRLNSEIYIKVLEEKVFPWIQGVAGDRPWVWQQDGAPCHTSDRTADWLEENCAKFGGVFVRKEMWPPNSLNANLLDYFYWSYIEGKVNKQALKSKAALVQKIRAETFKWIMTW